MTPVRVTIFAVEKQEVLYIYIELVSAALLSQHDMRMRTITL